MLKYLFYGTTILFGVIFYNLDKDSYKKIKEESVKTKGNFKLNKLISSLIPNLNLPNIIPSANDFIPHVPSSESSLNTNSANLMPSISFPKMPNPIPVEMPSGGGSIPTLAPAFQTPNDLKLPIDNDEQLIDFVHHYEQSLKNVQENIPIQLPSL